MYFSTLHCFIIGTCIVGEKIIVIIIKVLQLIEPMESNVNIYYFTNFTISNTLKSNQISVSMLKILNIWVFYYYKLKLKNFYYKYKFQTFKAIKLTVCIKIIMYSYIYLEHILYVYILLKEDNNCNIVQLYTREIFGLATKLFMGKTFYSYVICYLQLMLYSITSLNFIYSVIPVYILTLIINTLFSDLLLIIIVSWFCLKKFLTRNNRMI